MYDFEFTETAMGTWAVLRQTWIAVNKAAELKLAKVGLTPEKAAVLWACKVYPGTLTPAEIARLVFRENQTIAGLLNRMEKEGLVTRVPKRKGHPFTEVKLTPKGEKLSGPAVEILSALIKGLVAEMPVEEQKQLQKSLKKLRQKMMDEMHMELDKGPSAFAGKPIAVKL
jgi:MarR family transcriptional regulator, organic hydroperoxide resistance regulator